MNIQEVDFDVKRSGSNGGMSLGPRLHVAPTREKALNYAKRMKSQGAIFHLRMQLGRCYHVTANDNFSGNLANWQEMGCDSAFAGPGIIGERGEYWIKDPRPHRVVIQDMNLGHTISIPHYVYIVTMYT